MAGPRQCVEEPLIAELFHALNQPLTSLHCALELMIGNPFLEENAREALIQALAQADQIVERAGDLQELWEASHARDASEVALDLLLEEVVEEEQPAARVAGVEFVLRTEPCSVVDDRQRLRLALVRLLAYARDSVSIGHSLRVELTKTISQAQLTIRLPRARTSPNRPPFIAPDQRERQTWERCQNLRLAVVRRLLSLQGGFFSVWATERAICLRASLPLA